jgi:hypothetical protein
MNTVQHRFKGEAVVMPVPSTAIHADWSTIREYMITLATQYKEAAVGKASGSRGHVPHMGRLQFLDRFGTHKPKYLCGWTAKCLSQFADIPQIANQATEIAVVVERLSAERERTGIVGVPE